MKSNFKKNILKSAAVCLLPVVSYFLLCPLENFAGNTHDFEFGIGDFFFFFLIAGIVLWAAASACISFLPKRINDAVCTVVLAFGVTSYIQNMFLNRKMSEMDGSALDISALGSYVAVNAVVWLLLFCVIVAVSFFLRENRAVFIFGVSAFLSAIQLVAVVAVLISYHGVNAKGTYSMVGNDQFKLAKSDNVIILMLDGYGNVLLDNTLEAYPDTLDAFNDFTYYNNADCVYYRTFPSETHMFTGYDLNVDSASDDFEAFAWQKAAWNSERSERFFSRIRNAGYNMYVYESSIKYVFGNAKNLAGKADNFIIADRKVDSRALWHRLMKMSFYCYSPYILKNRFMVTNSSFDGLVTVEGNDAVVTGNTEFGEMIGKGAFEVSDDIDKAIVFQTLAGSHYPLEFDELGNAVADESDTTFTKNAAGCIKLIGKYIDMLKSKGLYDSSTIILMADHGQWVYKDENGKHIDPQPIFFIKRAGETHDEMITSSAPVSLDDFQATILEIIGEDSSDLGTSIWDWKDGDKRTRSVFARDYDENYKDANVSNIYNFKNNFNVYHKYTYDTDVTELLEKIETDDYETLPVMPWDRG